MKRRRRTEDKKHYISVYNEKASDFVFIIENTPNIPEGGRYNGFLFRMVKDYLPKVDSITRVIYNQRIFFDVIRGEIVENLHEAMYEAGEGVAFYDAIGAAILLFKEEERKHPDQKICPMFLLFSDNADTASERFLREQIVEMISQAKAKGWYFLWCACKGDTYADLTADHALYWTEFPDYSYEPIPDIEGDAKVIEDFLKDILKDFE